MKASFTKKSILTAYLIAVGFLLQGQQKTEVANKEGISISYSFKPKGSLFANGVEVNQYDITLIVDNDCGQDISITTPFAIRWENPTIAGVKQQIQRLIVGGLIGNGKSKSATATVTVPNSFQSDFINNIRLKFVEGSGIYTKRRSPVKRGQTIYNEQARLADKYERSGDFESAQKSWERALAAKPNDLRAQQKIKDLEQRAKYQRAENYRKANLQAQDLRDKKETAGREAQFNLMADMVGIIYKNLGVDKDNNIFVQSTRRFNLTLGFSFALMPSYSNSKYESYAGTTYFRTFSTSKGSIPTLNLDFGMQFWPWYGENWGIGILAESFGGALPLAGNNYSYQYNYGFQAIAGSKKVKASFKYLMGDRGILYSYTFSGGTGSSKTFYSSEGASYFNRIVIGPRFSFNSSKDVKRHLEVNYMLETYKNMTQIKSMGFNLTLVSDNRLRYYVDWMTNAARLGEVLYDLDADVKNQGVMLNVGIIRSFDWFGRK